MDNSPYIIVSYYPPAGLNFQRAGNCDGGHFSQIKPGVFHGVFGTQISWMVDGDEWGNWGIEDELGISRSWDRLQTSQASQVDSCWVNSW